VRTFLTYSLVGAINTIVAYLTYALLIYIGIHYTISLAMDYIVGIFLGLFLHKNYTFKLDKSKKIDINILGKSIILGVITYIVNIFLLYVLIDVYKHNEYLSQIIALIVVVVMSFLFYKFYIFFNLINDK
jgi:putative flippase GtrA